MVAGEKAGLVPLVVSVSLPAFGHASALWGACEGPRPRCAVQVEQHAWVSIPGCRMALKDHAKRRLAGTVRHPLVM